MDIFVCYQPLQEGLVHENIILACDNETNAMHTLSGEANLVEFQIDSLDQIDLRNNVSLGSNSNDPTQPKIDNNSVLKTIYFFDAIPNVCKKRILRIANITKVEVTNLELKYL